MKKKYLFNIITKIMIGIMVFTLLIQNNSNVKVYASDNTLNEIKEILEKYYVGDFLPNEDLSNLITNLNDPYTEIMDSEYYDKHVNATFFGIGATIRKNPEGMEVTSIMVNSPAMKAGLVEGDTIIELDDTPLKMLDTGFALKKLNGKPGVKNILVVKRGQEIVQLYIEPANVYFPTVYSKVIGNNIVYIHILSFGINTADEFKHILNAYKSQTINGYIVDIRNNPGGYISSTTDIASYFAKKSIVALGQTKSGEKFKISKTIDTEILNKTCVIMVNKNTASSAEILAACAQDYGTACIIGEKTYGKGAAQNIFKLSDGSVLKTTTIKLFTPSGAEINNIGITPDIIIEDNNVLYAAELLASSKSNFKSDESIVNLVLNKFTYQVNLKQLINRDYWEVYRQLLGQASGYNIAKLNTQTSTKYNIPNIALVEKPKVEYKVGERISFKLNTPNYKGKVQYRAILWSGETNMYYDLWDTKDKYYSYWKPKGNSVFNISFPINKAGNYRIKVFVKRSGILNSNTELKGMNCDSYIYEFPFRVIK